MRKINSLPWSVIIVLILVAGASSGWAIYRTGDWEGAALNFGTEMAGAVVTYWLLTRVLGTSEKKEKLIAKMGSRIRDVSLPAVDELRRHGWLGDDSLRGAYLPKANLGQANLEGADLKRANLESANLEGAILKSSNLEGAYLNCANLVNANLQKAKLGKALLIDAHLVGSDLENADLREAYLFGVHLEHADLSRSRKVL